MSTNNAQLINQDSGDFEYYTPKFIIDAAREVMGSIDLDPFSSEKANKIVGAKEFYSSHGLDRTWSGKVWMNHPFSRTMNPLCINKLIEEYHHGGVIEACCITFAATSEIWFSPLHNYPQCYLVPRTNFYKADGTKKKGVTKGSVVTYLGDYIDSFVENFEPLGAVKIPL